MNSVSLAPASSVAACSVHVKSYVYRCILSLCFLLVLGYSKAMEGALTGLFILSLLQLVFCGDVLFKNAWQDIRHGCFSFSVLVAVSIAACLSYNLSKTFLLHPLAGVLPDMYLISGGILTLYLMVNIPEASRQERSDVFIKKLEDFLPKSARLFRTNREQIVFARELKIGDQIRVKAGEVVPCEGKIVRGESYIEESFITGNTLPALKTKGSVVYAGTLNQGNDIWVEVENTLDKSVLAGIIQTIQSSERRRQKRHNPLDKYAVWMLGWAVVMAVSSYIFVYWAGGYTRPLHSLGIALLALGLGCPFAFFFVGIFPVCFAKWGAGRRSISIQSLEALAQLEKAAVVFLDKTGTLTDGVLTIDAVHEAKGQNADQLLSCLITVEQMVDGPFAKAALRYGREHHIFPKPLVQFEVKPGLGVKGMAGKDVILAGRSSWLKSHGVSLPSIAQPTQTVIYVARNGNYMGYVELSDRIRPGAIDMVKNLKQQGKELVIMSGDTQSSVQTVADKLGIEKINFSVLPQTKAEIIGNYMSLGKVTAMIGDGFNDMTALLKANVGVVFSTDKNVYNNWVDLIIERADLYSVIDLFGLYQKICGCIKSNVILSAVCYTLLLLALIRVPRSVWQDGVVLWTAMAAGILILLLNSVRLLRIK